MKGITWVGLDAHKKAINVAVLVGHERQPQEWNVENKPAAIRRLVKKLVRDADGGEVRCCYEAGVPSENPIGDDLCRHPPLVAVVQPTDFGNGDNGTNLSTLNRARLRRVLPERQVRASLVVVRHVTAHDPQQMPLVERDHVVEAFSTQ